MAMFRWFEYFFSTLISNLISSSSSSVTSMTLMAASWPVFVCRPWTRLTISKKEKKKKKAIASRSDSPCKPVRKFHFLRLRSARRCQLAPKTTEKRTRKLNKLRIMITMFFFSLCCEFSGLLMFRSACVCGRCCRLYRRLSKKVFCHEFLINISFYVAKLMRNVYYSGLSLSLNPYEK